MRGRKTNRFGTIRRGLPRAWHALAKPLATGETAKRSRNRPRNPANLQKTRGKRQIMPRQNATRERVRWTPERADSDRFGPIRGRLVVTQSAQSTAKSYPNYPNYRPKAPSLPILPRSPIRPIPPSLTTPPPPGVAYVAIWKSILGRFPCNWARFGSPPEKSLSEKIPPGKNLFTIRTQISIDCGSPQAMWRCHNRRGNIASDRGR